MKPLIALAVVALATPAWAKPKKSEPAPAPAVEAAPAVTGPNGKYKVDPEVGNSNFQATFDAPLGERIVAVSSSVDCDVSYDEASNSFSGTCAVPLTRIMVDNEPTKAEHFQQWATNKKSKPEACKIMATFDAVKLETPLAPEKLARFVADVPFTVCGRTRTDGGKQHVEGTALFFPAGSYGSANTIRVRARADKFSRDAYQISPKYTDGWLARVQKLASVVADEGTIDLSLFAKAK